MQRFFSCANIYFKRIVLAKLWKYFCKDFLELETGGVGINLRPLDHLCCDRDFSHSILLNQNCVFFSFGDFTPSQSTTFRAPFDASCRHIISLFSFLFIFLIHMVI